MLDASDVLQATWYVRILTIVIRVYVYICIFCINVYILIHIIVIYIAFSLCIFTFLDRENNEEIHRLPTPSSGFLMAENGIIKQVDTTKDNRASIVRTMPIMDRSTTSI